MSRDQRLYFPSEGRRDQGFFASENPRGRLGLNPDPLGCRAITLTTTPPAPIFHAKWEENVDILKSKHFHSRMSGEWNPCLLLLMSLKFYIDDIFLKILYFFRILMIMTFNIA